LEGSHSREQKPSKHWSDIPSIQRDDSYSMHSVLSESSASSGEWIIAIAIDLAFW
jgi:hypothetical protein